jgi:hypothetical protein
MHLVRPQTPSSNAIGASPITLPRALTNLGHSCTGTCTATLELNATVWFTRRFVGHADVPGPTLVVLNSNHNRLSIGHSAQLIRDINCCTRHAGIRVRRRRIDDHGGALAAIVGRDITDASRACVMSTSDELVPRDARPRLGAGLPRDGCPDGFLSDVNGMRAIADGGDPDQSPTEQAMSTDRPVGALKQKRLCRPRER